MEGLLEIAFVSVLTIQYVNRDSFGGYFNLVFAYVLFVCMLALPIFMQIFYQLKFDRMSDPDDTEFDEKYGAPYEGLHADKRWSLFFPFMICMRRITLMYVVLYLYYSQYA